MSIGIIKDWQPNQEEKVVAQSMPKNILVRELTKEELRRGTPEKPVKEPMEAPVSVCGSKYPAINTYIKQHHWGARNVEKQWKSAFPHYPYKDGKGKPRGVVVHETANPTSTINSEIAYMTKHYQNAFVHSFVDHSRVVNIADPRYLSWGAGAVANNYFVQVELVREHSLDAFAHSVSNDAYYMAQLLHAYHLKPDNAEHDGKGTVWSHNAVTRYLGGTTHTDPAGYFSSYGYSMDQFYTLINSYYKKLTTPYDAIKEKKSVHLDGKVKTGTTYNSYTDAYHTHSGIKKVANQQKYQGKEVRILKAVETARSKYLQFSYQGKVMGWMDKRAFSLYEIGSNVKALNLDAKLIHGETQGLWSDVPRTIHAKKLAKTAKAYQGETVKVIRQGSSSHFMYYKCQVAGKTIGWVDKRAFHVYETGHGVKALNKHATITGGDKQGLWSDVPRTVHAKQLAKTAKAYQGKSVKVIRQGSSSHFMYYKCQVNGETIGWIDKRAFTLL